MEERMREDSDLVLPPKMFAFVLDRTKGNVTTYCGPQKTSLSQTDQPVVYDSKTSRFRNINLDGAIQTDVAAKQGEYIVLTNTAVNGQRPGAGKAEPMSNELIEIGKTENIPGPVSFPLWPSQVAEVVKGHHLRSNQYLLVRVYDEEAAQNNWGTAVIKQVNPEGKQEENVVSRSTPTFIAMGKLFLVKGTDISFYIPPTGVEVVKNKNGNYVREACTLERLEYCILLEENGDKTYTRGPAVVFPTPTEEFITDDNGSHKFKAYELNSNSGIYVKVIADYEEGDKSFKQGQELFITGKDMPIYFPRMEHALIKYGNRDKHYAVAIPKGEARYVLNRDSGEVRLEKGPQMFLPNPIKDVIVKRILGDSVCNLYYPNNNKALLYNRSLEQIKLEEEGEWVEDITRSFASLEPMALAGNHSHHVKTSFSGDTLTRDQSYSPPRTVTLETTYDGAVTVSPWTGYAIQIVNKNGDRRVVEGPNTVLLEYDEQLEKLTLSTHTPKTDDNVLETVYLRTMSNSISDTIKVKTNDLVDMRITMKYLVRFVEDKDKWFSVENYIQYLCDHVRSMVSNYVRSVEITDFYENATSYLRDVILGTKEGEASRPNRLFSENNMEIYDVEVIKLEILDHDIANTLSEAKTRILESKIELETNKSDLELLKSIEGYKRVKAEEQEQTAQIVSDLNSALELSKEEHRIEKRTMTANGEKLLEEMRKNTAEITREISTIHLSNEEATKELAEKYIISAAERAIILLKQTAATDVDRANAIQPQLVEAITALAQTGLVEKISGDLAPLAIVQGESVAGTLGRLLKGTPLEAVLDNVNQMGVRPPVNGDARIS